MNIRLTCPPRLSGWKQASLQLIDRAIQKLEMSRDGCCCDDLTGICVDGNTFVISDRESGEVYQKSLYLNDCNAVSPPAARGDRFYDYRVEHAFIAANRGCRNNYFHWTTQAVLSIIYFLPFLQESGLPVIVPRCKYPYQLFWIESLAAAYDLNFIFLDDGQSIYVSKLVVPSTLYKPFDFAPIIDSDQIGRVLHGIGIARSRVMLDYPKKVYISRAQARRRRIVNEAKVERIVQAHHYEIINLEKLNVVDQIRIFMGCRKILAPHGAGLANLVFSGSEALAEVQEIVSPLYFNSCFLAIAYRLQLQAYNIILSTPLGVPDQAVGRHGQESRMNIAMLRRLLGA